jgi:hypothetical protein
MSFLETAKGDFVNAAEISIVRAIGPWGSKRYYAETRRGGMSRNLLNG